MAYTVTYMYIVYIAITIDSTLCDNLDEQFQVSEETGCSPYEYDNLASLIEQVHNTVFSLIKYYCLNCVGL